MAQVTTFAFPFLAFAIFLTLTFEALVLGGKDHLSHRLVRAGLSRRAAAISLWSASGVCALMAVGVYMYPDSWGSLIIGVFGMGWVVGLLAFLRTASHD
jgi:UDP-GlcNAc:undecaprenyl-phosphate GlcNAc-1-phosphate transferase